MSSKRFSHQPTWMSYLLKLVYLILVTTLIYRAFIDWAYDDPFITYRYAQNVAQGNGMVYNMGERVLSTTTPLFTLLLAGIYPIWPDLPHLANLFGAFSLAMCGLIVWYLAKAIRFPVLGWVGLLLIPAFPLLVSTLGSETPIYLALCLGAITAYGYRRLNLAAVLSALAVLTRPDGILVAAILAVVGYLEWRKTSQPFPWSPLLLFAGITLPWFVFSWLYFGSPLPVTLAAKQHQGAMAISQRFAPGLPTIFRPYTRHWYFWIEAFFAVIGFGWMVKKFITGRSNLAGFWQTWKSVLLLFAWTLTYFLAYALMGVSRYFWYYAPLVPGFLAMVGLGLTALLFFIKHNRVPGLSSYLVLSLVLILMVAQVFHLGMVRPTAVPRTAAYRAVGEWLARNTPSSSAIGLLEVGVIGYHAQRPVVDFAGLIQPAVASRLNQQATYEDSAFWAVKTYRPAYVVLHRGLFPSLEESLLAENCELVKRFDGAAFGYNSDLDIYQCKVGLTEVPGL